MRFSEPLDLLCILSQQIVQRIERLATDRLATAVETGKAIRPRNVERVVLFVEEQLESAEFVEHPTDELVLECSIEQLQAD